MKNARLLTMSNEEFCRILAQTSSQAGGNTNQDGEEHLMNPNIDNSLLSKDEKISVFMNLAIAGITPVPRGLCQETNPRTAPPEFFIVKRYKPVNYATAASLAAAATSKSIKTVSTKFQVMNADVFIMGASIPIRLDPGYVFPCRAKETNF